MLRYYLNLSAVKKHCHKRETKQTFHIAEKSMQTHIIVFKW